MKKSDNNIIRRTKRRVAMLIAFVFALSAIAVPGSVKEVRAEENPAISITYKINYKGEEKKSEKTESLPSDEFTLSSVSSDETLELEVTKVKVGKGDEFSVSAKGGSNKDISIDVSSSTSCNYSGSFVVKLAGSVNGTDYKGKIEVDSKGLTPKYIIDTDNLESSMKETFYIPSYTATEVAKYYNDHYNSVKFKYKLGDSPSSTDAPENDKLTISWTAVQGASGTTSTTYNLTGTIKEFPSAYSLQKDTITTTAEVLKTNDYTFNDIENLFEDTEAPFSSITSLISSLPSSAIVSVKKGTKTVSENFYAPIIWDTKPLNSYKANGSKQSFTIFGDIADYAINSSGTIGVMVPDIYTTATMKMTVVAASYQAGKVFDTDSVGVTADISSDLAKKIIQSRSSDMKEEFYSGLSDGYKMSVVALVTKIDSPESDESSAIKSEAKDDKSSATVPESTYFDISVYLAYYDPEMKEYEVFDEDTPLETTGSNIKFKYTVPSSYRKSSSSSSTANYTTYYKTFYRMYRYHNNASGVDDWKELSDSKLSFETSKFSTYAMAYYTSSSSSSKSSSSGSYYNGSSTYRGSSGSGSSPVSDTIDKSGAPKTGDDFDARKWVFILVIGVVVALCSLILYQDTKDWREDRKQ